MVLGNKIIVAGLVGTLFSLSGCGDRAKPKLEGHVYYADGVEFGVTTDPTLTEDGQYPIANQEGNTKGTLSLDHMVYDYQGVLVGETPCEATTEDAYDENGFLVGSCTLGISSVDALRGLSAYEIAVKDGFVGSEAEWLQSLQGGDGKNGKDGKNGQNGKNALTITNDLPVSDAHPNGAVEIKTGTDTNGNGTLDPEEVTSTNIVENGGKNGQDGKNSISVTSDLPASSTYPNGAVEIKTGIDTNGNGMLDPNEVTSSSIVENGTDGKTSLSDTRDLPVSSTYPNGAVEITTGIDTNGNGVLDANEVTSTTIVENGSDAALPTQPEYLCFAGDTDPKCGINQNDYKLSKLIFSRKNAVTDNYYDGGLPTEGIIFGETDSINWQVQRTDGTVLPAYSIINKWDNGAFSSNEAPYASHDDANQKRFRLISRNNALILESDQGEYASVTVSESSEISIVNSGLTIENNKEAKEICFTAEKTSCISYLVFWEPK